MSDKQTRILVVVAAVLWIPGLPIGIGTFAWLLGLGVEAQIAWGFFLGTLLHFCTIHWLALDGHIAVIKYIDGE